MKTLVTSVVFGLALVAAVGVGWTVGRRTSRPSPLTPETLAQLDKVFKIMADFQTEFENITGQAQYPDDKDKEMMKKMLATHTVGFQVARLAYLNTKRERSTRSLLAFVQVACGTNPSSLYGECNILQVPFFTHYEPMKWIDNKLQESKTTTYANVSRLESLRDEGTIMLTSMLKEIQ